MDYVATEVDGRVAVVTISNPPMNPLSAPLLEELTAEVERLDADDDVGAILLRGGGTARSSPARTSRSSRGFGK